MIGMLAALALATQPAHCRIVHGRLFAANGNPAMRIWAIGTKRILGVDVDQDLSLRQLPMNVQRVWAKAGGPFGARIYGDFRVCGDRPQRAGAMWMVRVVGARNVRLGARR